MTPSEFNKFKSLSTEEQNFFLKLIEEGKNIEIDNVPQLYKSYIIGKSYIFNTPHKQPNFVLITENEEVLKAYETMRRGKPYFENKYEQE